MATCLAAGAAPPNPPSISATWQVEVDRTTSAEWSSLLDRFLDASLYQTAAYGGIHWSERSLSRLVLRRDGEVVGMAQLRIVRPTPLPYGIAWLRWGPLWEKRDEPFDPEVPFRLARAIEDEYVRQRKLLVHILPNAFAGTPRAEVFHKAFAGFSSVADRPADIYRTFVLDLSPPLDRLRRQLDAKWRNKLKQAEKNSLSVVSGDGIEEYRIFQSLYQQMRQRKSFDTTVDVDDFARMQEALPPSQRMRVLLCLENGTPVTGLVASALGDSAIYLLGATGDAGLKARGAYLLQWTLIGWLKERGIRFYDLGGIDPEGNPGVYYFKRGFSGAEVSHIAPLSASGSAISAWMARTAVALRRSLRGSARLPKPSPTLNPAAAED